MTAVVKVMCVLGTRPELIKMAPVIHQLKKSTQFKLIVCLTGQHREMLENMMDLFSIKADYDLAIMQPNQALSDIVTVLISKLSEVLAKEPIDWLLVQGDTTTAFAASLLGFYNKVKVGHVEAGLRTYQLSSPFPEEANRQLISRIAELHFAPTEKGKANLLKEGVASSKILVTGNTAIDALNWIKDKLTWQDAWRESLGCVADIIANRQKFILVTSHRRENHGLGLLNICNALKRLAILFSDWHFVYPVHLNPNVQKPVRGLLSNIKNIHLINPLGYQLFVYVLAHCRFILTDSGGLQEEAPSLGKPVLVMRDTTERLEGIAAGVAKLLGTDENSIVEHVSRLIEDESLYAKMASAINPYGDGRASERIVNALYK